jgi:hypothetical protein
MMKMQKLKDFVQVQKAVDSYAGIEPAACTG